MSTRDEGKSIEGLLAVVKQHWGYDTLRPLQERAMLSVLGKRDSLVVLPTGGGKSLCYQAPAILTGGTTVVVSPLIALMKDQVDGLRACGVAAAQIDSSLSAAERFACEMDLQQGAVRLLFVSPERLAMDDFCRLLQRVGVNAFAIDEAHCISHWGHDFRPEYRQLARLKQLFPGVSVHGYTATATEQVRQDICQQLNLANPDVLVGNFDRANLNYRMVPRTKVLSQTMQVLKRHKEEPGIIYCLRRKDVDELSADLNDQGFPCLAYHAGLTKDQRTDVQEAFRAERCNLIVATVAFGMGIDRSNIRFVLHTAMPKSIEHYQQETGRAGRDGLEAECVLLYSGGDIISWKRIMEKSAIDNPQDEQFLASAFKHLNDLDRYCRGTRCRHRALVEYFGQTYPNEQCGACDICLGDSESVPDANTVAQKVLSCVSRLQERFGIMHVVGVLRGENTDRIRGFGHDKLSTYGLLKNTPKDLVRDWVYQLIGQGVLVQTADKFPVLTLNDASWEVLRNQREVRLRQPARRDEPAPKRSKAEAASWEGVDQPLFDKLRQLRHDLARERQLAPYLIFSDRTLREMARCRPASLETMHDLHGVGERKLNDFGDVFLNAISEYCDENEVERDIGLGGGGHVKTYVVEDHGKPMPVTEATLVAQKILSCVARLDGEHSASLVSRVLRARPDETIREREFDRLSTYGLLQDYSREQLASWIKQLLDQEFLQGDGRRHNPLLTLVPASWEVLRKRRPARLAMLEPEKEGIWDGVDPGLYETLADHRDHLADQQETDKLPRDWVLREVALVRPSTLENLRAVPGLAATAFTAFGESFFNIIDRHCNSADLSRDQVRPLAAPSAFAETINDSEEDQHVAYALFKAGKTAEEVMAATEFKRAKVDRLHCEYVRRHQLESLLPWVTDDERRRIAEAAARLGMGRLKPIYLALGEQVSYDKIRLTLASLLHNQSAQ